MSKGYHNYRGRASNLRTLLIAVLALVVLAAAVFMFLQQYIIYTDDGSFYLALPFSRKENTQTEEPPKSDQQIDLVVDADRADPAPEENPVSAPYGQHRLIHLDTLPPDEAALRQQLEGTDANGFVYTVRDNTGRVFYDSTASIRDAAVGAAGSSDMLRTLCQAEDVIAVARINCFHDSYYAWTNMERAGICQSNGYIWFDNLSYHWLEPQKQAARDYVIGLALECAQLGFDELLLEEMHYPVSGNLYKIDYSGHTVEKSAALEDFLSQLADALAPYDIKLSLLADTRAFSPEGSDFREQSGLEPARLAPYLDAIYTAAESSAVMESLSASGEPSALPDVIPVVESVESSYSGSWYLP